MLTMRLSGLGIWWVLGWMGASAMAAPCSQVSHFQVLTVAYPGDAAGNAVLDKRTGVQWRRCEEGQGWDGLACRGRGRQFSHEQALSHAAAQGLWQLPDVKQLGSLPQRDCRFPALNSPMFVTGALSRHYWSGTPNASASFAAWRLEVDTGRVGHVERTALSGVRLSRR